MHKTKNLDDGYMGSGKRLKNAIKCYGIENFHKDIIYVFDAEEKMKLAEKILVVLDEELSYNLCPGGHGGFSYINATRDHKAHNQKLADNRDYSKTDTSYTKNINYNELGKKRIKIMKERGTLKVPDWTGRKHKESAKLKMSISHEGSKNSQFGSMWITNGTENRKIKKIDIMPEGWYKGRVI